MHDDAPGPTDEVLWSTAVAGDPAALELLLRRHADLAWTLALRALGGDHRAAESAVGLAWEEASRTVSERDPGHPVQEWLVAAVVRACEQTLPRWQSDPPPPAAAPPPDTPPDGTAAARLEPWEALTIGLSRLPWSQRVAWLLVEVHELSARQAARVLELPEAVLDELLLVARAALTRHLGDP